MNRSSDTRRWVTVLTAAFLMAVTGTLAPGGVTSADEPGSAGPLPSETQLVAGGPGNQTDPHLSGSLLTYTEAAETSSQIRYVDLAAGTEGFIPNVGHRDELPDVSGSLVVFRRIYTDGSSSTRPILVFDVMAPGLGVRELAPEAGARRRSASIGGTTVAFVQEAGGLATTTDVCVADVTSFSAPAICLTSDGGSLSNRDPAVSPDGTTVAFTKCAPNGTACDVYVARRAADGSWESPRQLTGPAGQDVLPDTDGTIVTYASNAGGDSDIWWQNVDGTSERQLVMMDAPGSIERDARLSGGAISFERELPGTSDADLYLYRPSTEQLDRLTATPADETLNAVSISPTGELRVAWAAADGLTLGHNDIHALRTQLTLDERPVLQLPADITVTASGPAGAAVSYEVAATDDDTAPATVTCDPASGATFAVGPTTVTCTASDAGGQTVAGTFTVTVTEVAVDPMERLRQALQSTPMQFAARVVLTTTYRIADGQFDAGRTRNGCEALRAMDAALGGLERGRRIPAPAGAELRTVLREVIAAVC